MQSLLLLVEKQKEGRPMNNDIEQSVAHRCAIRISENANKAESREKERGGGRNKDVCLDLTMRCR